MIYKRFGNPHIKLWNNELERLFKFKPLIQIKNRDDTQNNHNDENENTPNNMTVTDENTTILQ